MKKLYFLCFSPPACALCCWPPAAAMVPLDANKGAASSAPAASAAASGDKADGDAAGVKTIESGKLIMATNAQFPPYEMVADGEA